MVDASHEDSSIAAGGSMMPPPVTAAPGYPKQFGNYVLLAPLAAGGMGEVFLASSSIGGAVRLVVIKTLRPDLVNEPGYIRRFQDEARIALELAHKNVSQVFDVGVCDGVHYIAMEHIAGATLRRVVEVAGHELPPAAALLIGVEALEGLASAHAHKHPLTHEPRPVVHRDVSPHNIMLSYDGDVKLIDFGLAYSETKTERTGNDVVLGKIAYMSPEQARGDRVDGRSDQFSFAIVLYEMLAGQRFYGSLSTRDIWLIAGSGAHEPPHLAAIAPDVRAALTRALSFDPEFRFASCTDFADALRAILRERYPGTDKSTLRALLADLLKDERAESELSLRGLAPAALSAISASRSRAIDAMPTTIATVHDHDPIPETTAALAQRAAPNRFAPIAAAAAAGLAMICGVAWLMSAAGEKPTMAESAPQRVAEAKPVAAPVVVEDASDAKAVKTLDPVPTTKSKESAHAATNRSKSTSTAVSTPKAAVTTTTTATLPSDWRSWPLEKKVKALEDSDARCAKVLLKLRAKGNELQPGAIDACLASL